MSGSDPLVAVIDFDKAGAERRAERIRDRLDLIADNYTSVLPLIREAIEKRDDIALDYRSVGEYVSDRFGGALTRLGIEVRREVVRELTDAGLSTRAIAPVFGVSRMAIQRDIEAGVTTVTPEAFTSGPAVNIETGEVTEPGESLPVTTEHTFTEKVKIVTGLDGKTYTSTPKQPREPKPVLSGEAAAQDAAEQMAMSFGAGLVTMWMLTAPERRAHVIENWPRGQEAAVPPAQEFATPEMFRAIAVALDQLADEWEKTNV